MFACIGEIIKLDMSADRLKLLVALDLMLEHGNITKAARQLGVSPPALSAQLARLRDLLGDPLLVPARNGPASILASYRFAWRSPVEE